MLLVPAVFTAATSHWPAVWPLCTVFLSIAAAIYCGFWLARRLSSHWAVRLYGGMALTVVLFFVSFALCCAGCALTGTELQLH